MRERFYDFISDKFNIAKDEINKIFILQLNIFLIISVLLIIKPLFTSLMLTHYGKDVLPVAYGIIAVIAVIFQAVLHFLNERVTLHKIIIVNYLLNITGLTVLSVLMIMRKISPEISLALYIYVSLFSLITVTYFYQFTQTLISIREAKRIFAYVASGAIAGGVFGGYYASLMVNHIGNPGLIITCVVFLLLSLIIHLYSSKKYSPTFAADTNPAPEQPGKIIFTIKNKHVFHMVMIVGLGVITAKLIDYQFNTIAYQSFKSEESLTAFFGFWFSSINIFGLLIQVLLVNRVLDRYGVTLSLAVMPLFLLLGTVGIFIMPILAMGVFVKLIDGSFKQSIYKTSTELNIMPLPIQIRNSAKTLLDVVVDSLATGIAGVFIYMSINVLNLPLTVVSALTIMTIILWLLFIRRSKNTYTQELSKILKADDFDDQYDIHTRYELILNNQIKDLRKGSEKRRQKLIELAEKPNEHLQVAATNRLYDEYSATFAELRHLREDNSYRVRFHYFFRLLEDMHSVEVINRYYDYLEDVNKIIFTAALAKSIGSSVSGQKMYGVRTFIEKSIYLVHKMGIEEGHVLEKYIFLAISHAKYKDYYYLIKDSLNNKENPAAQYYALNSIAHGDAYRMYHDVCEVDYHKENREAYLKTLAHFPNKLLLSLKKELNNDNLPWVISAIPAVQYANHQGLLSYLYVLLDDPRLDIRRVALTTINTLKKRSPNLRFNNKGNTRRLKKELQATRMLMASIQYLNNKFSHNKEDEAFNDAKKNILLHLRRQLEHILIYLGLITERGDIEKVFKALNSEKRDNAIDYLDTTLDYKIRSEVIPILELLISNNFTKNNFKIYEVTMPSIKKVLQFLKRSNRPEYREVFSLLTS